MSTVFVQVRDRTRGNVTAPMIIWALVMAVVLFMLEARVGSASGAQLGGVVATAFFGIYLGWRRRVAAAFVAPIVSWLVAWMPLLVASMIRDGFLRGLVVGVLWITVGWILIGFVEFVWLFLVASLVRILRGPSGRDGPDVVVFGPDDQRL